MIKCAELDKEFETKHDMFKALLSNEKNIIDLKKASIQKSCDKGQLGTFSLFKSDAALKSSPFDMKEDYVYAVINTTKFMDSHGDVHMDGIWNKSAKEQDGKTYYVADHELKISSVIAYPEDVNVLVKSVPWSFVGKNYEGETEALIYEFNKDNIKLQSAKEAIESKRPVQNSIRMQYVKIRLAIDSTEKEFKEHKDLFDSLIDTISNKDLAKEVGYFWVVDEAKIVKEGSMVLFGSNEATPVKIPEAVLNTPEENEPPKSTQKSFYSSLI